LATNTATHTEAPGGHKPAFPPFQKDTFASQLVWLVIAFVALYLLISRIAVPRIGGIFEERTARIEDDLAAAQRLKAESEAALATYEKSLADARNNAQTIAGETRDKLNAQAEERRKALEAELNVKLADAEKQIAAVKAEAMISVNGAAVETAVAIVERLMPKKPEPAGPQEDVFVKILAAITEYLGNMIRPQLKDPLARAIANPAILGAVLSIIAGERIIRALIDASRSKPDEPGEAEQIRRFTSAVSDIASRPRV